jgi:hypothetical protein
VELVVERLVEQAVRAAQVVVRAVQAVQAEKVAV